ncbi:MAG: deoxyribose-phosphate aldolase [Kiritimatiellales bacterium]|nr:deoxyribose-phosphate aldolase [Kiritimatiellales bacterium]
MAEKLKHQIAKMIDHSLLNPIMTDQILEDGCRLAVEWDVASVCIKPYYMARCAELLKGSTVVPSTVIGFPHGGNRTDLKLLEAEKALEDGGIELDAVVNIGKVLSHDWAYVEAELKALAGLIHQGGGLIKVIFENAYLKDEEKIELCKICTTCNVDWVKTSTGYAPGGATPHDLKLMRANVPDRIQVKAAGGVRDLRAAIMVRDIGGTRFGATATVPICTAALEASDDLLAPQPIGDSFTEGDSKY